MSHASSEPTAFNPIASHNPLAASEPWNLVANGYAETTMLVFEQFADVAIVASKLKLNSTVLDVFKNKFEQAGRRNIKLHCGEALSAVVRKGKDCAGLVGRDTAYVEGVVDFGCVIGWSMCLLQTNCGSVSECFHS